MIWPYTDTQPDPMPGSSDHNILAIQARNIFSSSCSSSKLWFWRLRQLCLQYSLPHPYEWLDNQPSKLQVKTIARSAVLQFWLAKLRSQADHLSSSWGSPPVTPCSDCVAAHHGKWRRLPVKHVSYQGDTGLSPCQVIGLHGIRRVYVPYQSAGAQSMLMLGLWRVSSPPATPSPQPEWP